MSDKSKTTLKLLQDYQKKHGLTQEELAHKLNTSQVNINRWLRGKHAISKAWQRIIGETFGEVKNGV